MARMLYAKADPVLFGHPDTILRLLEKEPHYAAMSIKSPGVTTRSRAILAQWICDVSMVRVRVADILHAHVNVTAMPDICVLTGVPRGTV